MFWLVKNPQVRGCVPSSLSCFFVTRSKVRSFFSFHSPRKEQVFTWLGGQKMHNESKSRFDHQQRADCAPPVIYLRPISSSVWQSALTGSRRAGMWPCSSLDPWKSLRSAKRGRPALPFLSDIRSSSLLFHFTLAHVCGRWESGGKAESPRKALGHSCQMRLHNFKRDLPVNLISWGETACLLTVCHTPARQQVLHL